MKMQSENQEIEKFWDEFSGEYEEIQSESVLNIAEDVAKFLLSKKIFPCEYLLDLAGGSGKYLPAFSAFSRAYDLVDISQKMLNYARKKDVLENVRFIHQNQAQFLQSTASDTYDFVFSAMNPALFRKADLVELNRISKGTVGILRLKSDTDLFAQVEKMELTVTEEDQLLREYKKWLKELAYPFSVERFSFNQAEIVSADFFSEYFSMDFSKEKLADLLQTFFEGKEEISSSRRIVFELLYWEKGKL